MSVCVGEGREVTDVGEHRDDEGCRLSGTCEAMDREREEREERGKISYVAKERIREEGRRKADEPVSAIPIRSRFWRPIGMA